MQTSCTNSAHLSENINDAEGGEKDYDERDEETKYEQEKVVAEMILFFPCWTTAHSVLHHRVSTPPRHYGR